MLRRPTASIGFNIHGVIFDELHTQPNQKRFDVITRDSVVPNTSGTQQSGQQGTDDETGGKTLCA